jgi:translation initiation factor IF-2
MSETKESTDKTSRAGGPGAPAGSAPAAAGARKPLSLTRTVETGSVRQSFSHGRSKAVVVEKKKKIVVTNPSAETERPRIAPSRTGGRGRVDSAPRSSGSIRTLSTQEMDARNRALAAAREREVEEAKRREEEAVRRAAEQAAREAEEALRKAEEAKAAALAPPPPPPAEEPEPPTAAAPATAREVTSAEPTSPRTQAAQPATAVEPAATETEATAPPVPRLRIGGIAVMPPPPPKPKVVESATAKAPETTPAAKRPEVTARRGRDADGEGGDGDEDVRKRRGGVPVKPARAPVKTAADRRERGKLTITNAFNEEQRERSLASLKRKRERERLKAMGVSVSRDKIVREVVIPEVITIQELSNRMAERAVDIIKLLMKQGQMHKITDVIDADTAELIVTELGHTPKRVSEADVLEGFIGEQDAEEELTPRAPVVTIMGHVDHGKTSLLDAIRQANVAGGEAGGITQHIGAYQVSTSGGDKITFIDTPGHEAFTAMRARGAKVTDIVVLVVAADDGVMPQTVEAISHAKAAGVPIIVAINKIDKPDADPTRVRTDLLQHEIVVESMSGDTQDVPVSALKGTNLDKLLEAIALQAEVLELKANAKRSAEGFVIEAKLERGRGPVGTLLVQRGTLEVGDIVVAGMAWGRVRALLDDKGRHVGNAGPSVPVEVLGFDSAPEAGDQFAVVENEARAREITDYRIRKRRETLGQAGSARTLEQMMQQLKEVGRKEFTLLVKGDVQGSVEAIVGALKKLGTDEVEARIIHTGVGGITESDVSLANATNAVIVGFNVRANIQAKQLADQQGVEIRYYNIIYNLVDDVKAAMSGLLAPTLREVFLGNAQILQVFNITKAGKVAGCRVTDGKVERGAKVRLIRDNVVIHEGTLAILKRFKDDVREVPVGQECGMSFANYQDIREGDVIECFNIETVKRTL